MLVAVLLPGFVASPANASAPLTSTEAIVERSLVHVVARGEGLGTISARYGVRVSLIAAANGLDARKPVFPGQQIQVLVRHVVPPPTEDGIVVNVPQRMLYLFRSGQVVRADPVTVGRSDWQTPLGEFTVLNRQSDKTWVVPPSIQREMLEQGKPVLTSVPPGPDNPLGRHWIGTSLPGIGIHGTNAAASVYGFRSHGCIRMHPDDVAALFAEVKAGDRGRIVYRPLLLARAADGSIWFEANPDAYRRGPGSLDTVREMARLQSIDDGAIDWALVEEIIRRREGFARDVRQVGTANPGEQEGSDR